MEWADAILEYGTNIILIVLLAFAVLYLWKQYIADRDRHYQETKEREDTLCPLCLADWLACKCDISAPLAT